MAGIQRIKIKSTDGWDRNRSSWSEQAEPLINAIYHTLIPLKENVDYIEVEKDDAKARYDYLHGIDLYLHCTDGSRLTVQEKVLTFPGDTTATFEEYKNGYDMKGSWYTCAAQLYFVAYYRNSVIDSYVLIDYPKLKLMNLTQPDIFNWRLRENKSTSIQHNNTFRYIKFQDIPQEAIVAKQLP